MTAPAAHLHGDSPIQRLLRFGLVLRDQVPEPRDTRSVQRVQPELLAFRVLDPDRRTLANDLDRDLPRGRHGAAGSCLACGDIVRSRRQQ